MKFRGMGLLAVAAALIAGANAWAADKNESLASLLAATTEKIGLQGRKGPSLFQPGFAVGEYTGSIKAIRRQTSVTGVYSGDKATASVNIERPGMTTVTADCKGGQSRLGLGWITLDRDRLTYVCKLAGGAPAGAEFALAEAKGSLAGRMMQPQRAAELAYGRTTLRAETRYISGLPLGGGAPVSYVIFRPDGTPVGGLQMNGLRPVFYLPKTPGPERDAVAVMALTLFAFQDPGQGR